MSAVRFCVERFGTAAELDESPGGPPMSTTVHLLTAGYADDRVASSVTLVRDGDALIVADPGMVASRSRILDPLAALGVRA